MPGPWVDESCDGDYFDAIVFEAGELREVVLHDVGRRPQGRAIVQLVGAFNAAGTSRVATTCLLYIEDKYLSAGTSNIMLTVDATSMFVGFRWMTVTPF